jgi:hypothetical protein
MLRFSENLRPRGDENRNIQSVFAMAIISLSVPSALRLENAFVLEMKQCVNAVRALEIYMPAPAAVSTAGTALGNKLLSPESQTAVAAIAGNYLNFCTINKQTHRLSNPAHNQIKSLGNGPK